jgi:hypothetical protein
LNENHGATPPGNRRNILKRGNKVTRRRDLRPAQPVVRQRGGVAKKETTTEKTTRAREGRGQHSNRAALQEKL